MKNNNALFRTIVHIRLPNFYSAVEEALQPGLRMLPLIVCGYVRNRYVPACANSRARARGITNNITLAEAYRRAPNALFYHGSARLYESFSREFFRILSRFSATIEPTSLHSAFMELEGFEKRWISSEEACRHILAVIAHELEIVGSAGVAGNKVCAEVASNTTVPGSVACVPSGASRPFLAPLPLELLPGIGRRTVAALKCCGVRTIGDIARASYRELVRALGPYGMFLWQLANALDRRPVIALRQAQSVSCSSTFAVQTSDVALLRQAAHERLFRAYQRMRSENKRGKTIFIRIQYHNSSFRTRQITFIRIGCSYGQLRMFMDQALVSLLPLKAPVRSMCVGLKNLRPCPAPLNVRQNHYQKQARVQQSLTYMKNSLGMSSLLRKSEPIVPELHGERSLIRVPPYGLSPRLIPLISAVPA